MKKSRLFALLLSGVMALSLLTACGSKEPNAENGNTQAVDLPALWASIEEQNELPFLEDLDGDTLQSVYGIDSADLESYIAKIPVMNVHATEFFLAQVKEGKMDTVTESLTQRQADLLKQWERYLPEQYELVENYKLQVNGDYVLFCVSEHADKVLELFNDATK